MDLLCDGNDTLYNTPQIDLYITLYRWFEMIHCTCFRTAFVFQNSVYEIFSTLACGFFWVIYMLNNYYLYMTLCKDGVGICTWIYHGNLVVRGCHNWEEPGSILELGAVSHLHCLIVLIVTASSPSILYYQ